MAHFRKNLLKQESLILSLWAEALQVPVPQFLLHVWD